MEILSRIVTDVLTALYEAFGFSLLLAFLALFLYLYAQDTVHAGKGYREAISAWFTAFRSSSEFRKIFLLSFVTGLILFRTLLNRQMWMNPLSNVMGGWTIWVYDGNGNRSLNTECIENVLMTIPFTFLVFSCFIEKIHSSRYVMKGLKIGFLLSVTIEVLQLLLRLGTFQFADLVYNTLGGGIGGMLYFIYRKIEL